MNAKVISKDKIPLLLDDLIERFQVWAPVVNEDILLFDRIESGREAVLEFSNTKMSPKKAFLPQSEVLFLFDGVEVEEAPPPAELVLFGVRPCDAASLLLLDKVFDVADYPTVYYGRRRDATFLVGIGCVEPASTCFCTDVGGDPFGTAGLDVLLFGIGDRYLVELTTENGRRLLQDSMFLEDASSEDVAEKERIVSQARQRMQPQVRVEGLKQKLDDLYQDQVWEFLHEICLGCGLCTYACPTCHCFDIVDETEGDRGKRFRIWDSCQYPLFTHHSSGHNPRPSGGARMRQRIMHKFHYLPQNVGILGCVGCGRCVRNCPVGMDIRETLNQILDS